MATSFSDWEDTCLMHYGIKGQKWGVRRYQNPDGTLTAAGKKHEQKNFYKSVKEVVKSDRKNGLGNYHKEDVIAYKLLKNAPATKELGRLRRKLDSKDRKWRDFIKYLEKNRKNNRGPIKASAKEKDHLKKLEADMVKAENDYYKRKSELVDDLLGKYGKRKITIDKTFGIPSRKPAGALVSKAFIHT